MGPVRQGVMCESHVWLYECKHTCSALSAELLKGTLLIRSIVVLGMLKRQLLLLFAHCHCCSPGADTLLA